LHIFLSGCYTIESSTKQGTERILRSEKKTGNKNYTYEIIKNPTHDNPEVKLKIQESEEYKIKTSTRYEYLYRKKPSNKKIGGWSLGIGILSLGVSIFWTFVVLPKGKAGPAILYPVGAVLTGIGIGCLAAKKNKYRYHYKENDKYYFKSHPLNNSNISIIAINKSMMFETNNIGLLYYNPVNDFDITYVKNNIPINFNLINKNIDFNVTLKLKPSAWLYKYAKILTSAAIIWKHKNNYSSIANAQKGLKYKILAEDNRSDRYKVELFKNKFGWINFRDVETYYSVKTKIDISIVIKNWVEEKITQWQKQGEFESPDNYFVRMEGREGKLKKITYEAMESYQADYINMISWNAAQISRYDPNSQTFKVKIPEINEFILHVPLETAQTFKENWGNKKFKNQTFILVDGSWELSYLTIEMPDLNRIVEYNSELAYSYNPVNQFSFNLKPITIDLSSNNETDDLAAIKYDISINLPKTNMSNPEAIAVVIGNTNYKYTSNVDYAINDAQLVKTYLVNSLGYKPGNVLFYKNASKADFEGLFGTKDNYKGKLYNYIKAGISDVFIFYSGHGAPGLNDQKGYFVPVDCDPIYVELQGYNSDVMYNNLATISAKSVTVITDACFSGADIIDNISSILPEVQQPIFKIENGSLLSSSSTNEIACWLKQQQHGLFTYFFLKAIHDFQKSDINDDSKLTLNEIYNYVSHNSTGVPYFARRLNAKEQNPTLVGNKEKVLVEF